MSDTTSEHFLPVSRFALLAKLREAGQWDEDEQASCEQLYQYLSLWKHQTFRRELQLLKRSFLPFSPDRDTHAILDYSAEESATLQQTLLSHLQSLLQQANYTAITLDDLQQIFNVDSPYGLQLKVDLSEFDEVLLYARGSQQVTKSIRHWKSLFLKKVPIEVPVYQRLFLLLKLKPAETRISEIMRNEAVGEKKARKKLRRYRENLPDNISGDHIIIKLFKNIPRADLEMLFPNTQVKLKTFDKLKLGITAGGGTIGSVTATATKLAAAANPTTAAAALAGLVGVVFRQVMKFFGQRTKYMMVLAQNLYFHNLANNRAALTLLTDRAEEEAFKNTLLAYFILHQQGAAADKAELQQRTENFIRDAFAVSIRFDVDSAITSLRDDKLITNDKKLQAIPPAAACQQLEMHWQNHIKTLIQPDNNDEDALEA